MSPRTSHVSELELVRQSIAIHRGIFSPMYGSQAEPNVWLQPLQKTVTMLLSANDIQKVLTIVCVRESTQAME